MGLLTPHPVAGAKRMAGRSLINPIPPNNFLSRNRVVLTFTNHPTAMSPAKKKMGSVEATAVELEQKLKGIKYTPPPCSLANPPLT